MKLSKKQKKWLARILIAAVLFVVLEVLVHVGAFEGRRWWIGLLFALVPYLIVGYDVILKSLRNISRGDVFDENFLMMIATFGAFGIGEYPEAVAVMLLYQTGELFQNYATGRSRDSIADLMSIAPEMAFVERDDEIEEVDPDEVEVGEIIVIRPGDRILLCSDGLYGMVPERDIARILRSSKSPERVCGRLINTANENGGRDNISAVYIKIG